MHLYMHLTLRCRERSGMHGMRCAAVAWGRGKRTRSLEFSAAATPCVSASIMLPRPPTLSDKIQHQS